MVRRHWHIDLGFAAADLEAEPRAAAAHFPGARYIFVGFGDRHYLLAKRQHLPAMLAALFPGAGLILVTAVKSSPAEAFGERNVIELNVPAATLRASQIFIGRALLNQDGTSPGATVSPFAPGPYAGSLYFNTPTRYSAFHTCNTWAAEALEASGLPVRSEGVVFAGQLWKRANALARTLAAAPFAMPPSSLPVVLPPGKQGFPARADSSASAALPRQRIRDPDLAPGY